MSPNARRVVLEEAIEAVANTGGVNTECHTQAIRALEKHEPQNIGVEFKVSIRPDGELIRVTIMQGVDSAIYLTQAQAEALAGQINARFK